MIRKTGVTGIVCPLPPRDGSVVSSPGPGGFVRRVFASLGGFVRRVFIRLGGFLSRI
jgi:hypothetical protein